MRKGAEEVVGWERTEPLVMRKLITGCYQRDTGQKDGKGIYIGEDVEHGGYYLVSDGEGRVSPAGT